MTTSSSPDGSGLCAFCPSPNDSATGIWNPALNMTIWSCRLCGSIWMSRFFRRITSNPASITAFNTNMDNDTPMTTTPYLAWPNAFGNNGLTSGGFDPPPPLSTTHRPTGQWPPRGADPEINPPFHQFDYDDRLHRVFRPATSPATQVSVPPAVPPEESSATQIPRQTLRPTRQPLSPSSANAGIGRVISPAITPIDDVKHQPRAGHDDGNSENVTAGGRAGRQTRPRRFRTREEIWKYTFHHNHGVCDTCRTRKQACMPVHLPWEVLIAVPQKTWDECPRADWLVDLS